ncbi:40S ribosomal protein S5 [Tanacetum coccineum]
MMHGRNNGKKLMAVRIVKDAMEIIHLLTDANPIQIIVDAIINSGPREDATRIGSAGVVRRQAVDISPLRRVNQAIYLLTTGVRESAFRNVKTIAECLADELINAAKGSSNRHRQLMAFNSLRKFIFTHLFTYKLVKLVVLYLKWVNSVNLVSTETPNSSYAIKKKDEIERVAKANR